MDYTLLWAILAITTVQSVASSWSYNRTLRAITEESNRSGKTLSHVNQQLLATNLALSTENERIRAIAVHNLSNGAELRTARESQTPVEDAPAQEDNTGVTVSSRL